VPIRVDCFFGASFVISAHLCLLSQQHGIAPRG
jgi:hypothetical protein